MNKNICGIVILLIALSLPKINYSQNLVQNPSFEDHINCNVPQYIWDTEGSYGQYPDEPSAAKWYSSGFGTADYYNTCSTDWRTSVPTNLTGTQTPHTGNAYAGIITFSADSSYKEYLENKLLTPLIAGRQYTVSFWISRSGPTYLISNSTAIHFSTTPYLNIPATGILASSDVTFPTMISSNQWTQVQGTYTAVGGEEWITIGNFLPFYQTQVEYPQPLAAPTSYYYIDDVSITEIPTSGKDTVYLCSASGSITAGGSTGFSFNVLSGAPTITGNGPTYNVTANTPATVIVNSTTDIGGQIIDTFLIVPAPHVDAGLPQTLNGCNNYSGILNGSISNTASWVNYAIAWNPAANITAGANTLTPTIAPNQNTLYQLTVSTDNTHGNCTISDSVLITVHNQTSIPNFSYTTKKGCKADTVIFTNQSQNAVSYSWDFGDGTMDTTQHPVHIYHTQGLYAITLTTRNGGCISNITKNIDTRHPLKASYTTNNDIICQGSTVSFNNTSIVTEQPPVCNWFFGDGTQATTMNATHTYNNSGTYNSMLVVSDAIPCFDTAFHAIAVDSIIPVRLDLNRKNICTGESITFNANTASEDNTQFIWDFGDGNTIQNGNTTTHAYDNAGAYPITLTTHFLACPDIVLNDAVMVHALPIVNLGPDTALCLDGKAIPISNLEPSQPGDQYAWNTGETTASTFIKHPGIYKLTVTNAAGCATTDEVEVKKDCYIDIPNSFTPNNDGVNDYFFPRQELSQGVTGFTMQVFDRWGEKIFETSQTNGSGWDGKFNGKDQPEGVYIYVINAVLKNGRMEHYTGNVTLLR